jgi:hypothetical protein
MSRQSGLRQLLELFVYGAPAAVFSWFAGEVECDESSFAGMRKGGRSWRAAGKAIVLGIVQRAVKAYLCTALPQG